VGAVLRRLIPLDTDQQAQLLRRQSEGIDRIEKFHEDWWKQNLDFQRQALHLLHMFLDRLPLQPGSVGA
jgi:hypothetical protein